MSEKPKLLFTPPRPAVKPTPKAIVVEHKPSKQYSGLQITGVIVGGLALGGTLVGLITALVFWLN